MMGEKEIAACRYAHAMGGARREQGKLQWVVPEKRLKGVSPVEELPMYS